jgi:predicted  nucleic acid-binding Zn-ribbon protein
MNHDELDELLVVQERDARIRKMQTELSSVPNQRNVITQRYSDFLAKVKRIKQKISDIEKAILETESEITTKRNLIAKMKIMQGETHKNDEYQRYITEIAKTEELIDGLETRELSLMETLEVGKNRLEQASAKLKEIKTSVEEELARLERSAEKTTEELKETQADRESIISRVSAETRDLYNRMIIGKALPVIVTMDDQGRCSGCHMNLTTATRLKVQSGREVCHCENCGRILF